MLQPELFLKPTQISPHPTRWDAFVSRHPQAHILQTSAWGQLKSRFGWESELVALAQGEQIITGALILYRRLPFGLGVLAYCPKGPLVDWSDVSLVGELFAALDQAARARGAFALSIEPDLPETPENLARLRAAGLIPSPYGVQPRRTLLVDIRPDEDDILAAMKSKTRYNVRLSARKGVTVRQGASQDVSAFNALMAVTGARDEFGVHSPAYYKVAYDLFPTEQVALFLAEYQGEPLAGLLTFALGRTAWYFYGASSNMQRNLMAPYAIQWAAVRWAKAQGCATYDLWGVPDEQEETLEAQFTERNDGLWGVYRFKRGFGGRLARTAGAWERVYGRLRYQIYRWALRWRHLA